MTFVRCFGVNSIGFVEQLFDDRRSLDDAFVVPARTHDIEKTLKNLDRAHKIRVRRCSADPCAKVIWTANYFENASKKRTKTRTAKRSKHLAKIDAQDPRKSISGGVRASQIVVRQARSGDQTPSERMRPAERIFFSQSNAAKRTRERNAGPARSARGRQPRAPV